MIVKRIQQVLKKDLHDQFIGHIIYLSLNIVQQIKSFVIVFVVAITLLEISLYCATVHVVIEE